MNITDNRCVCSGIRSCLLCQPNKLNQSVDNYQNYLDYYYCWQCGDKAFTDQFADHNIHQTLPDIQHYIQIDGIFLKSDVIDVNHEAHLIHKIDSIEWIESQSGRRKQDFGPKVNFKKQRVNFTQFRGLPDFDIQLLRLMREQMSDNHLLNDFIAVEVCHLDYNSLRGSSIDPHFDDFWLWGPRLVTVNLLSPTILTLILPKQLEAGAKHRIRVELPQRSLVILSADSRFKYQHSIESQDIRGRRLAITYRELSPDFLGGGPHYEEWGRHIISRSLNALTFN